MTGCCRVDRCGGRQSRSKVSAGSVSVGVGYSSSAGWAHSSSSTRSEWLRRHALVAVVLLLLCCCCCGWSVLLTCEAFRTQTRIRSRTSATASIATTAYTRNNSNSRRLLTTASRNRSNKNRLFLSDIPDEDPSGASSSTSKSNDKKATAPILQQQDEKMVSEKRNNHNPINKPNSNFWTQWWQYMTTTQADSRHEALEDKFTLGGDLLAIAVYGWTDHFFGADFAHYLVQHTEITTHPAVVAMPAWMSPSMSLATPEQILMIRTSLSDELVAQYSPLLQTMGGAATSLAVAWLVAGYIWQSFRYHNTMGSSPDRVLVHTALTWFTATTLLLLATVLTNGVALAWWNLHHLDPAATATLAPTLWPTQGDLIFAIDAWSLLTMWRFLISIMLGGGGGGTGRK